MNDQISLIKRKINKCTAFIINFFPHFHQLHVIWINVVRKLLMLKAAKRAQVHSTNYDHVSVQAYTKCH